MATVASILLGLINIAIVIALLLLIGAVIEWILSWIAGIAIPVTVRKAFLVLVALIALYMLVALILGMPTWRIIPG
jgi:hypothetical protein